MSNKQPFNIENWILKKSKNQKKHNSKLMLVVLAVALILLIILMATFKTNKLDVFAKNKDDIHFSYFGNVTLNKQIRQNDLSDMFSAIHHTIQQSDYASASLNINKVSDDPKKNIQRNLKNIDFLKDTGFNSLNLTNNSVDLEEIKQIEKQANSKYGYNFITGNGSNPLNSKVTHKTVKGKKVATVSFTDISSKYANPKKSTTSIALDPKIFIPLVKKLKQDNDMVIVNVDWGIPDEPNVTDRQKEYGHALADAGADVVLGHNTVVQKIEKHKGTNIFYSLGNVTSDDFLSENKKSIAVQQSWNGKKSDFLITPIRTSGDKVTRDKMNPVEKKKLENRIADPSIKMKETKGGYTYES
ncbi:poly-gamma-glutamate synthesis protein PgsA [Staphylococcus piscifermentans]|uniref:Capsular polysaccharide biosynthesis protein CapA n=1 Tax=Staphylococcus piscifermentans TaxID=70258 RepID=A0A239TGT6_9STAP|nr:CapA family protein [Staphylococcus piscifermentans]RTX85346.1 CapA family protein [Staphylococcus piscifermentans]GEP85339.1 capsular polysaccharide biosynthesis protein CapA [Staphylococcus piscifermentans]SNU96941.1 poly-gamma-glutamate synthesis protein PgsA [Staphylococcus piscifermentans]